MFGAVYMLMHFLLSICAGYIYVCVWAAVHTFTREYTINGDIERKAKEHNGVV